MLTFTAPHLIVYTIGLLFCATAMLLMLLYLVIYLRDRARMRRLRAGQTVYVDNVKQPERIKATFVEWRQGKAWVEMNGLGVIPVEREKISV